MIQSRLKFSISLGILIAVVWVGSVQAQVSVDQKIEPKVLSDLWQNGKTTFFVVLSEQADVNQAVAITDWSIRGEAVVDALKEVAERTQQPILDFLANTGAEVTPFWIVNTIKVTTDDEQLIQWLGLMPGVAVIKADEVWQIPEPQPAAEEPTIQGVEWGVARVQAPEVWSQFEVRGEGVVVANIDSGVQHNHPALVGQYRGNQGDGTFDHNYNWHDPSRICGNPSLVPCDNNGHGTHTMGTSVGDDGGANQIGVAPGARWIAAKGCETSSCSSSALLSSGQWVLAPTDLNGQNPRPDLRPHIVNNSWGGGTSSPFYRMTVQNWRNAGIFPAFAAGNPGSACGQVNIPGAYPESFAVGATDINDNIASFSGRGPATFFGNILKPNVSAPGVNVRSSSSVPPNSYTSLSGTSMATPHVSGVIALLWSAIPALRGDIAGTEIILQNSSEFRPSTQCGGANPPPPNNVYGWGIVDALAAVRGSAAPVTLVASPASIPAGGTLTATWSGITGIAAPSATDWIGLYQPGAPNTAYIDWIYVSCSQTAGSPQASGSCPFTVPSSLAPGSYELRLLADNGYTALAISNIFTVTAGDGGTTLTASLAGSTVTATWNGIAAPTSTDWIGLYQPGADNTAYIDWIYISCSQTPGNAPASGSCLFVLPGSLAPGTYELRLLANNGYTALATSNTFTTTSGALARTRQALSNKRGGINRPSTRRVSVK